MPLLLLLYEGLAKTSEVKLLGRKAQIILAIYTIILSGFFLNKTVRRHIFILWFSSTHNLSGLCSDSLWLVFVYSRNVK